jgi:hypothetical protein
MTATRSEAHVRIAALDCHIWAGSGRSRAMAAHFYVAKGLPFATARISPLSSEWNIIVDIFLEVFHILSDILLQPIF